MPVVEARPAAPPPGRRRSRGTRGRARCGRTANCRPAITATASSELDQRQHADREAAAELEARDLDRPGLQLAAVGGEQLQQPVLDDDREAERDQQRRQQVVARACG